MNKQLFKYYAASRGDTMTSTAKALNVELSTLSNKLSGKSDFTRAEIKLLSIRWALTPQDVNLIFFDI